MAENIMKNGAYLGVDYGDRRTGLAKTDVTRFLSSSLGYVSPNGMKNTATEVARQARELGVVKIVVGMPKNMNGSEGDRAQVVKAFVELLAAETDIPIDTYDERLTTVEAYGYLNETGYSSRKRRQVIDGLSAQIMLQDYIDREKRLSSK